MRVIETTICNLIYIAKTHKKAIKFKKGNTQFKSWIDDENILIYQVYLHNSLIYQESLWPNGQKRTMFSLCGWNTRTTRSRLNALGINITNIKGDPYYIDKENNKTYLSDTERIISYTNVSQPKIIELGVINLIYENIRNTGFTR